MNNNNLDLYEKRNFINLQNGKLMEAIEKENIDRIKKAIKNGADIDRGDGVPFQHAVKLGKLKSIEFLITEKAAYVRNHDDLALKTALENKDYETAKLLLKHGALISRKDNSFLKYALQIKEIELIKFILDNGAVIDPAESIYIELAIETDDNEIFQLIVNRFSIDIEKNKDDLLCHSVKINSKIFIEFFINKGANINYKNNLLLSLALQNKNIEVAKLLLTKGVIFLLKNVHLQNTLANIMHDRKQSINMIRYAKKMNSNNIGLIEEQLEQTNILISFVFSLLKIEDIPEVEKSERFLDEIKKEIVSDLLSRKLDKLLETKEVIINKKLKL